MPINRDALLRYRILDRCFRDTRKYYDIDALLNEIDKGTRENNPSREPLSRRQIYYDITFMESEEGWSIDLVKERHTVQNETGKNVSKTTYRYADTSFSIENMPLSENELSYIRSALETLSNFRGLPQLSWMQEALACIRMLSLNKQIRPCFEFEENPYLGGRRSLEVYNFLAKLFDAIQTQQSLLVSYRAFDTSSAKQFRLHPQYLKQSKHRWYVLSVTTERPNDIFTLAVDRIVDIAPCKDPYISIDFDPDAYFDDIIGISNVKTPIEDVHLQIEGWAAPYIETDPLHGSQVAKWIEDGERKVLDVHLNVKINHDLEGILMTYADCIKVLAPASLAESHAKRVSHATELSNGKKIT